MDFKSKSWVLKKNGSRPNRAWLHTQPYDHGVYVLWGLDSKQLKAEFEHVAGKLPEDTPEEALSLLGARYINFNDHHCIAFGSARPSPGIIAHEAFHYVEELSRIVDLECEESKAYLIGCITDRIYELTRNKACRV